MTDDFGPLTRQHLQETSRWLSDCPDDHWFVQLLAADAGAAGEVESFLARARVRLDPAALRVYVAAVDDTRRIGIIYGDYETRRAALQAAAQLPEPLRAGRPFPRQVGRLRQR